MDTAMWANVIAGLAFVVSILAAVFSWKSALQAKLANRISVHTYQKELLEKFLGVYTVLSERGSKTPHSVVSLFSTHAKVARLYVSANLAKDIEIFYGSCIKLEHLRGNVHYALEQVRIIAHQSIGTQSGERATAEQKSSADAAVIDSKRKLTECVKLAKKLGEKIDKALVDEIKIV
jgi:hypothetical protein